MLKNAGKNRYVKKHVHVFSFDRIKDETKTFKLTGKGYLGDFPRMGLKNIGKLKECH